MEKGFKPSGTVWVIPDPPLALGMGATWVLPPSYISTSVLPQLKNPVPGFSDPGRSGGSVIYSVMHVSDQNIRSRSVSFNICCPVAVEQRDNGVVIIVLVDPVVFFLALKGS